MTSPRYRMPLSTRKRPTYLNNQRNTSVSKPIKNNSMNPLGLEEDSFNVSNLIILYQLTSPVPASKSNPSSSAEEGLP